uniref:PNPLA domain-containing protein n=1 Tax=Glossina brevipalpis TaxID=37001 RepID=A0A1A9WKE4_9MUSC
MSWMSFGLLAADCALQCLLRNDYLSNKVLEIKIFTHTTIGAQRCSPSNTKCPSGCNSIGNYDGIPLEAPEFVESRQLIENLLATTSRPAFDGILTSTATDVHHDIQNTDKCNKTVVTDIEKEQKDQSIMDALLEMFTSKINTESKKKSSNNSLASDSKGDVNSSLGNLGKIASATSLAPSFYVQTFKKGDIQYGHGRVLCLDDGGGIRGLILIQMLLETERLSQTPIIHLFDWIAGTSTGGILALALGVGKSMRQCMGLWGRNNVSLVHDLIPNYYTDIQSTCSTTPLPEDQLIWRAARATGAAPSYFRAFDRFLDGGLIANNPNLDAMTEIHEYNMALCSIGCNSEAIPISILNWPTVISAISNLLVDQATATNGRVIDRARAWCSTISVPYYRFNPQLSEDIATDEKNDQKLINMLWCTKAYMHNNRNKIIEMINLLK